MSTVPVLYLNDVSSDALGVWMEVAPPVVSARERGEWVEIAGRHGEAWRSDNAYEGFDLEVQIYVPEDCDLADVMDWIRGAERLRWGGYGWEYHVSAAETQLELAPWDEFPECGQLATVVFHAEPFRYLWPEAEPIECVSGMTLNNPGTAEAAPLITLTGSGDVTLSIGGYVVNVDGMSGGCVIDCEAQMAWNLAMTEVKTQGITLTSTDKGRWPRLSPGGNAVAWVGNCLVSIQPRWRDR